MHNFAGVLASLSVAEQEVENLSGLSPNPNRDIFVVRDNGTTCLMAEFALKIVIPYDVLALNGIDVSFLLNLESDFRYVGYMK